jgi:DNA-binding MarR family transcriptional regulator
VSHEPPDEALGPDDPPATRLGILTAACEARRIDFVSLRELLDVTDGNRSRHLTTLEDAGHITIEKTFEGRRPRTWISATAAGRKALTAEIAALREIVGAAEQRPRRGARAAADRAL